jgi:hypothetical protein
VAHEQDREHVAHVVAGTLGWGNRKGGLEAYGPGGRWAPGRNGQRESGDLLGDTFEELGAYEGSTLIAVAWPSRSPVHPELVPELIQLLRRLEQDREHRAS